jgi:hypothetical protein
MIRAGHSSTQILVEQKHRSALRHRIAARYARQEANNCHCGDWITLTKSLKIMACIVTFEGERLFATSLDYDAILGK